MKKNFQQILLSIIGCALSMISYSAGTTLPMASPNMSDINIDTTLKTSSTLYQKIFLNIIAPKMAQRPLTETEKYCFLNTLNYDEKSLKPLFLQDYNANELKELESFFQSVIGRKQMIDLIQQLGNKTYNSNLTTNELQETQKWFMSPIGEKYRNHIDKYVIKLSQSDYAIRTILCNIPVSPRAN